jgi:hypothetical protein
MKTIMKTLTIWIFIMSLSAGLALAIPPQINYQGYLTNPSSTPLDTTVSMTFQIYPDTLGGPMVWQEAHNPVTVTGGLFHVTLGETASLPQSVMNMPQVWLGIRVGSDPMMTPMTKLVSVPYSYRVGTIDGASGGTISGDVTINGKVNGGTGSSNPGASATVFGANNGSTANYATVSGGLNSGATAPAATVGGGNGNVASNNDAVVSGGYGNSASGSRGTVGGGAYNMARGAFSTVGGGGSGAIADSNSASGLCATIAGGARNSASNQMATVGGGSGNLASGGYSTISGGVNNQSSNIETTVCGGGGNIASGWGATVCGGYTNTASGFISLAAGMQARAVNDGSFVWADGNGIDFTSTASNQFSARASGGFRMVTNPSSLIGSQLPPNSTAWIALSDSTKKTDIRPVDTQSILQKVAALPVREWRYKAQPNPSIRHIGPMAQDFWAAFHLGEDSLGISTIDPAGIALAAIQELNKKVTEIDALKKEVADLRSSVQQMAAERTPQSSARSAAFVPREKVLNSHGGD